MLVGQMVSVSLLQTLSSATIAQKRLLTVHERMVVAGFGLLHCHSWQPLLLSLSWSRIYWLYLELPLN